MSNNRKPAVEGILRGYVGEKVEPEKFERGRARNGYWKSVRNVVREARRVKREYGLDSLPGMRGLQELGESALGAAIVNYHGGMRTFRTVLGEEQKEREKGIWKDKDFVVSEINRVMQENDLQVLPGTSTLVKLGQASLAMAITKYHGGFRRLRDEIGQPQILRERGLWNDLDYVLKEARAIKRKHKFKQLPGGEALGKLGYSAFLNAVQKYHGGMNNLRSHLGEDLPRTDSKLLRDEKYILKQARKIMKEENLETLPGGQQLYERGYASFVNAVNRHHGGIPTIREKLGQEEVKKPTGYWNKFSRVKKVIVDLEKELGRFPTQRDLQQRGYGTVANAITHAHGGINSVRERLGFEVEKKDKGYYTDPKNVEKEIKKIIKENPELRGEIPSAHWLQKHGYAALCVGIGKIYGSYKEFRQQRGLPALQVETGRWKDLEFTLQEAKKFMEEHKLDEFPGTWTINKLGYSSLGAAIQKYHGGVPVFREKLNDYLGREPSSQRLESFLENYAGGNDE